jgi:hypothetical protein
MGNMTHIMQPNYSQSEHAPSCTRSLTLLVVNLILIVVDQDPGLSVSPVPLETLEVILGLNIIIEYPLRVWSAGSQDMYRQWLRLRFMLEPLMLIELLVCFYIFWRPPLLFVH